MQFSSALPLSLSPPPMADLLRHESNLHANILVFPHHGGHVGGTGDSDMARDLCSAVSPQTIIFSIGRGQHNTPQPEVIEAVLAEIPNVWVACTQLSERCANSLPLEEPAHLAPAFSCGLRERKCCCGTFVLQLDSLPFATMPRRSEHRAFVEQHASTALCLRRDSTDRRVRGSRSAEI